jgi:hypothetical protein
MNQSRLSFIMKERLKLLWNILNNEVDGFASNRWTENGGRPAAVWAGSETSPPVQGLSDEAFHQSGAFVAVRSRQPAAAQAKRTKKYG